MPLKTLYISLIFLLIGAVSQSELSAQCSYNRSVIVTPNVNGSYMYGDLEIPSKLVQTYDYKILENGSLIDVDNYTRGCICEVRRCLRICSDALVQAYDNSTEIDESGYRKSMTLKNGKTQEIHLVHDFHHVVGHVCPQQYPLEPEKNEDMEWTLYEDNYLLRHKDRVYLSPDEYCFELKTFKEDNVTYFMINPHYCGLNTFTWNVALNGYAMAFSVPFLLLTIICICCLPHRMNVHCKCFLCYLSSLAMSYTLISFVTISKIVFQPTPCKAIGYTMYYCVIAYLTWTCVISYDTWNYLTLVGVKISFRKYFTVGWSVPLVMTTIAFMAETFTQNKYIKPGIDASHCGLNSTRWAASIYLYVPCTIVFIYCLVLYIKILVYLVQNKRGISPYTDNIHIEKTQKERFFLYFRLYIAVSWFFEILSYLLSMTNVERTFFYTITDIFNAGQGLFILLLFIFQKEVWDTICKKLTCRTTRKHQILTQTSTMEMSSS